MPSLPPLDDDGQGGKFKPKNRKKLDQHDLKKMAPQQRSRYLAYEDPPKEVSEAMGATKKRLLEKRRMIMRANQDLPEEEYDERDKHAKLIGQLKAAEARNRLRIMRLRYQANRAQEISHLIACQPTALKAVRLQALVPAYPEREERKDRLDKLERVRVERLLEDTQGLLTNRIH
ncbi:protein LKAAEAR1-like [Saccostrea echinata]|uniref:protein LKAAEAR1-like n=1 Tax=Saccostrea echinata TaxID=191078 RepID=UPI002A80BD42|nr:protein LKAAEAR1-like [Saccostrea echinata]